MINDEAIATPPYRDGSDKPLQKRKVSPKNMSAILQGVFPKKVDKVFKVNGQVVTLTEMVEAWLRRSHG